MPEVTWEGVRDWVRREIQLHGAGWSHEQRDVENPLPSGDASERPAEEPHDGIPPIADQHTDGAGERPTEQAEHETAAWT
jgi:hypothetical protein